MLRPPIRILAGASLALVTFSTAASAQSKPAREPSGASQSGAVAYPNNPIGTPTSGEKGTPVVTDHAACPPSGNGRCPDKPPPSGSASSSTAAGDKAESGGVRVPATAYPQSPVTTPATKPDGIAPK